MLCHKLSLTMNHKNCRRRCHHQFANILMLSIIWTMLFTRTMARPHLEALLPNKPTNDLAEQQQQQDLFLDEISTNANSGGKLFNKLQKYHHNQPHYLSKWPGLRDLVLTLDYDDNNGLEESNEFLNTKFFERLRQLASSKSDNYYDDIRYDTSDGNFIPSQSLKDRNIKKNVQFHKQYMSPCHFKICNMGRKRDAHSFNNN